MTSIIVQKEWSEYRQDVRLRWIVIILFSLFAIALFTGIRYYVTTSHNSQVAQKASYEQWLKQGKKNPHGAAHYGFYAYKPLSAMAIIDKGMEGYLGQAVWLEAHNQNEVKEREATDAGSIVRFGYLSIGFIFQFLLPLAIILLGFNLFSKEREWETLPLLLSSNTSVGQLFTGKALALYKLVMFIFVPMLLIAFISILLAAGFAAWVQVLPLFLVLTVFYLLYLGIWVMLSLFISSLVKYSSISLVGLLAFWIVGTFFTPRMSGLFSKMAYPTPSSFAFSNAVRMDNELGIDRKTPASQRQKAFEDSLLSKYGVKQLTDLPLNIRGLNLKRGEEYGYLIFEKNYGGLETVYRNQNSVINWCNLLSPAQGMRSISAGISGTDINKQAHFAALAERHRRLIANTMNDDISENSVGIENYEGDERLWEQIPPFQYEEASLKQILQPQWIPILSLVIWFAALLLLLRHRAMAIQRS